jgi:hypothetical protein
MIRFLNRYTYFIYYFINKVTIKKKFHKLKSVIWCSGYVAISRKTSK